MPSFADRLKELRSERGYTQRELADRLNVSHGSVSMWEIGQRHPDHDMIHRLADFFGVSTDYLLGRTNLPDPLPEGVKGPEEGQKLLGQRLRTAREKAGHTIDQAADVTGIAAADLRDYEAGAMPPTDPELDRMVEAYCIDMGWLLTGREDTRAVPLSSIAYLFPPDVANVIRARARKYRDYIFLLDDLLESGIPPATIRAVIHAIRHSLKEQKSSE